MSYYQIIDQYAGDEDTEVKRFEMRMAGIECGAAVEKRLLLFKSHISGYTKKTGVYVSPHNNKRIKKQIRQGTSEKQIACGEAAFEEMVRFAKEKLGGAVLGTAIPKEFKETGRTSLIGRTVKTGGDLAMLAQVYRDPRIETFRVFYVDGDKIVGQTGITARLPGLTDPFLGQQSELHTKFAFENMRRQMGSVGADRYYLLHNHPSGSSTASAPDIRMTQVFNNEVAGLEGHVIIDNNEYDWIGPGWEKSRKHFLNVKSYDNSLVGLPHDWLGEDMANPYSIAALAKRMQQKDGATTIIGLNKNIVTFICEVPDAIFNGARTAAHLRILGRMAGSSGGLHAISRLDLRDFVRRRVLLNAFNPDNKKHMMAMVRIEPGRSPAGLGSKRIKGFNDNG